MIPLTVKGLWEYHQVYMSLDSFVAERAVDVVRKVRQLETQFGLYWSVKLNRRHQAADSLCKN
jgi:hypothetical protein